MYSQPLANGSYLDLWRNITVLNRIIIMRVFLTLFQMFNIYIKRAAELYGITHTRAIYEKAIEILPEDQCRLVQTETV